MSSRTIVIALDHSNHASHTFDWAKHHILTPTDNVVLINVRPVPVDYVGFLGDTMAIDHDTDEDFRSASHHLLQHYGYILKNCGFNVRAISIRGEIRSDLVRKTKELGADLLICGSRGLGKLKRAFMGSVSNYLVNHCTCPVLVVRPPENSDLVVNDIGSQRANVDVTWDTLQVPVNHD